MPLYFYAVAKGRTTGIYNAWPDCEAQVRGFSGAIFKKFKTVADAKEFIKANSNSTRKYFRDCTSNQTNSYQRNSNNNLKRSHSTSSKNTTVLRLTNTGSTYSRNNEQYYEPFGDNLVNAPGYKARPRDPPQPKKYRRNETTGLEEDVKGFMQVYTSGGYSSNENKCVTCGRPYPARGSSAAERRGRAAGAFAGANTVATGAPTLTRTYVHTQRIRY